MNPFLQLIEWTLPSGVLAWFDITSSQGNASEICVTLTEKNNPPLTSDILEKKIESKGFKDITVTDFPLRGKRLTLTFRRRYWQVEGRKELLKRDIELCATGTQLGVEFADFLKDKSGDERRFFDEYCPVDESGSETF